MAKGFLGRANLAAATDVLLFTASETPQTFNVRFANRNTTIVKLRVAIGLAGGSAPALDEYVDYDVSALGSGILEDTGLVASAGEKIWVRSDTANVSVRAHGM